MSIYDLFIYDRFGQCLIHRTFNENTNTAVKSSVSSTRAKLIYGLLITMQDFVNKLSPNADAPTPTSPPEPLLSFHTSHHKVHYFASPTGLKFVLTSDPKLPTSTELLKRVYKLFVDYVVSTPYYTQGVVPTKVPSMFEKKLKIMFDQLGSREAL